MSRPIAYEPHPVTPERKAELIAQGFKIVDAVFKPADAAADAPTQEAKPAKGKATHKQEA